MKWSIQSTSFEFLIFVVWKTIIQNDQPKQKKHIIIDICRLNQILQSDFYSLFLQTDITSVIWESHYIFTVNCVFFFYQWLINSINRFKFTVISHWDQKHFNIVVMKYQNLLSYVQQQMNHILWIFWAFVHSYVDNIVIFFWILNEHIEYLCQVFELFQNLNISLKFKKFYIDYLIVTLLRQCVNILNFITAKKKIKIIINLQFSIILKVLKTYFNLIEWLQFYVLYYTQITASLQTQKTILLKIMLMSKDNAWRQHVCHIDIKKSILKKICAFYTLQKLFAELIFLCHFNSECYFYIDVNVFKQYDFDTVIYHVNDEFNDTEFSCQKIQSILFLSKLLTLAEQNYWFMKMKTTELVWMIWKTHHLIEFSFTKLIIIVITNYNVTTFIARQSHLIITVNIDKLNLQLVCVLQYFSQFSLNVQHCSDKIHLVSNVLSRLLDNMKIMKNKDTLDNIEFYHIILVKIADEFKQQIQNAYKEDSS